MRFHEIPASVLNDTVETGRTVDILHREAVNGVLWLVGGYLIPGSERDADEMARQTGEPAVWIETTAIERLCWGSPRISEVDQAVLAPWIDHRIERGLPVPAAWEDLLELLAAESITDELAEACYGLALGEIARLPERPHAEIDPPSRDEILAEIKSALAYRLAPGTDPGDLERERVARGRAILSTRPQSSAALSALAWLGQCGGRAR